MMKTSRRNFVIKSALAAAGIAYSSKSIAEINQPTVFKPTNYYSVNEPYKICIFSKHFPGLDYNELAAVVAEMGFDGIDLTVREEGHVLPENAERDLPLAVAAAEKFGLKIYMITTSIVDAEDKLTEPILKTAASLGIRHYRMGPREYEENKSVVGNLDKFKTQFKKLDRLNRKYQIRGECQNHSGYRFSAPVWDMWETLKDLNPRWTGVQYDVLHATVEGAYSLSLGFDLLRPYIGTMDVKDFVWKKTDGRWELETVSLGEGMVDYKKFITLLKEKNMKGPFSLHCEYLTEKDSIQMKTAKMKQDLTTFKNWLKETGL